MCKNSTHGGITPPLRKMLGTVVRRLGSLLIVSWFLLSAQVLYAQNPVITLSLRNVTVREMIEAVKAKSGYSFWFRESEVDLQKRVSVEAQEQPVLKVLDGALADQGLLAKIEGRHIVLYKAAPGAGKEYLLSGRVESESRCSSRGRPGAWSPTRRANSRSK